MGFYFKHFNITEYEIDGKTYDLTNITLRYKFKEVVKNFNYAFHDYTIPEDIELQNLSHLYYDSSEYTWLIILCNDIIDPHFDYPLNSNNFKKYILSKYGSWEYAQLNVNHFERFAIYKNENEKILDLNKPIIIDQKVYENSYNDDGTKKYPNLEILYEKEKRYVSILDYEIQINENKRKIKLIDKTYVSSLNSVIKNIFE